MKYSLKRKDPPKKKQQNLQCLFSSLAALSIVSMVIMYAHLGTTPLHDNYYHHKHIVVKEDLHVEHTVLTETDAMHQINYSPNHSSTTVVISNISDFRNKSEGMKIKGVIYEPPKVTVSPVKDKFSSSDIERTVAIGLAITTKGQQGLDPSVAPTQLPFFRRLLLSFCHTCSNGFEYHFYVAHDHNDPFFAYIKSHKVFTDYFYDFTSRNCPHYANATLHLVECKHSGNPAWAQNDAMMHAYMHNMAYYYRVNDDTVMETTTWTEKLIDQLLRYNPPNVGVAGPWFRDGNTAILTHDFVHRTHIDIFGFYYPRVFSDWFADDWITGVYWPERSKKVPGTRVKHTMEMGSRYVVHYEKANRVHLEVTIGKSIIKRWLIGIDKDMREMIRNMTNVISISLWGDSEDMTFGILRYAQILPIIMKNWRIRVYVEDISGKTVHPPVSKLMLRKLDSVGVEVVTVDNKTASSLPPDLWKMLIADDLSVKRFLLRDATFRPSKREKAAVENWSASNSAFHCIRDHPWHASQALTPAVVGGVPSKLKDIVKKPWILLMQGYTSDIKFMNEVIWPLVKDSIICHDSVSCNKWPNSRPYPVLREDNEYVGQPYDDYDLPETVETRLWPDMYNLPECVLLEDTGFDDDVVRSVIKARPVIWSQDYHVTPIMDIKSLLRPIGVKIIDKSLSYYCGQTGTCAQNLRVINRENGMRLTPEIISQFYNSYVDDPEMQSVTAFMCTLPVSMCEAFLPFNKSMIIIASIRYEQGRPEVDKWQTLNENIVKISKRPDSIIAANNLYDLKYLEYFTGLKVSLVPNHCGYLQDSYQPKRKQFLITPIHSNELSDLFFTQFDENLIRHKMDYVSLLPLRQLYPQYLFSDLAAHPAIVYIPYQVSMSSLTEQYRMNIPLFFPSLDLLTGWQLEYQVVRHRTWAGYMMKKSRMSAIKGVMNDIPDPNNDLNFEAVKYWLQFADFYQWPHIIYYDSVEDLVKKMQSTNLTLVSEKMKYFNHIETQKIKASWSHILRKALS